MAWYVNMWRKPSDIGNFEPSDYEVFISLEEVLNPLIEDDASITMALVSSLYLLKGVYSSLSAKPVMTFLEGAARQDKTDIPPCPSVVAS